MSHAVGVPTRNRVAVTFSARMAASHGLSMYLVWLAFESKSAAAAGWVLVARAVSALVVPLAVGHVHDRGRIGPWLRLSAAVEAVVAMVLAYVGWRGAASWVMVLLSLVLGATSSLFDTVVYPLILAASPSRLRPHVLVGLSYDVAKVIGSSLVMALLAVWHSPVPVMAVSLLALAGWRLPSPSADHLADGSASDGGSPWRDMPLGPVIALGLVALLPGQVQVFQVASAHSSFFDFGVLGTSFALGAVAANLVMQRLRVSYPAASLAYLLTAASLLTALQWPVPAFFTYGVSIATYYQLTRVLVIEAADPAVRGRVSAAMTAVSKVVAVAGSVLAAVLVHHHVALHVVAAVIAVGSSVSVTVGHRLLRSIPSTLDA